MSRCKCKSPASDGASVARLALSVVGCWAGAVGAQQSTAPAPALPEVLVIGTTPVPGLKIDIDKVPGNVQSLFLPGT